MMLNNNLQAALGLRVPGVQNIFAQRAGMGAPVASPGMPNSPVGMQRPGAPAMPGASVGMRPAYPIQPGMMPMRPQPMPAQQPVNVFAQRMMY